MASFADIAKKKIEDVERPPLPPAGHYVFSVTKPATSDRKIESAKGSWECVDFSCTAVEAMEDVDQEELEKFGGPGGVRQTVTFMFPTEEEKQADFASTEFRLRQFLEALGVSPELSLGEALGSVTGHQFVGLIGYRPDPQNKDIFYAEIKKTTAIS